MAVNTKAIKNRIRSVGNIKKITKAMELVAAAKMKKAVEAALNTKVYAGLAWELLVNLSKSVKDKVALLEKREIKKVLVIIITSNRGLCGSYNSNIIKKTTKLLEDPEVLGNQKDVEIDVVGIGKKGINFAKKNNYNLIASFEDVSDVPTLDDILPISKLAVDEYRQGNYDKVVVAYTDFKSSIAQTASLKQVLPISEKDLEEMQNELGDEKDRNIKEEDQMKDKITDYVFEPNRVELLKTILPRLVEVQIFQAVLESAASEHSSRMMAMKNANESANDMIKELKLSYNKARQAAITQEIAEIAGGAAALE